jgi:hypothetical protein
MFFIVLLICTHSDDDVAPSSTVDRTHSQQGATGNFPAVPDLTSGAKVPSKAVPPGPVTNLR